MLDRFETFATTISFLNRCVQRIKTREMETVGLKSGHVMCMYVLGRHPEGMTAAELQKACGEDKAAISRTVGTLLEKGYVRMEDPGSKRAYRAKLYVTEEGRQVVAYIGRRAAEALEAGGQGLGEAERATFYAALCRIAQNLDRYLEGESAL